MVRPAEPGDLGFMQQMLYQAANRPGDDWPPFEECVNEPRNSRFWRDFPRDGEVAVIAERGCGPVGAAWIRTFVGDELSPMDEWGIPVLAIAVVEGERGRGVGHRLMTELISAATDRGVTRINLATSLFNMAAVHLYERHGFKEVLRRGDSVQMRLEVR